MTATLTISSKNYSSWSLRGWLLAKLSGIEFVESIASVDDHSVRAELLLLTSSNRVPRLEHNGVSVWDTLAIGEYLNEVCPDAGLLPSDIVVRAHCRSICGEMHSGFTALRAALPIDLRAHHSNFVIWSNAQADIDHIVSIWRNCFDKYQGPYLFGNKICMADAMYAPVVTRFLTYGVPLDDICNTYCDTIMSQHYMQEWVTAALQEPEILEDEFEIEF
jgi:glutathione S-transferase